MTKPYWFKPREWQPLGATRFCCPTSDGQAHAENCTRRAFWGNECESPKTPRVLGPTEVPKGGFSAHSTCSEILVNNFGAWDGNADGHWLDGVWENAKTARYHCDPGTQCPHQDCDGHRRDCAICRKMRVERDAVVPEPKANRCQKCSVAIQYNRPMCGSCHEKYLQGLIKKTTPQTRAVLPYGVWYCPTCTWAMPAAQDDRTVVCRDGTHMVLLVPKSGDT